MNHQISEEAAQWFVECRMGEFDESARRRFDAWIRSSPEHLRAYLETAVVWNEGPALDRHRRIDLESVAAGVRAQGNVVPLAEGPPAAQQSSVAARRAGRRFALAAGLAVAVLAAAGGFHLYGAPIYTTGVGEQRSITLRDGSTLNLNARTRIEVRFTDDERAVELLAGQALFQVARDAKRPFVVRSDAIQVRAIGTEFDVYRKSAATVVTVVEGRVAVSARGRHALPEEPKAMLDAGEQAVVARSGSIERQAKPNIAAVMAWTERRLVFESATLQDIAEEFNRYSPRRFVVRESSPQRLRLSGVFSSNDLEFLVRFLRERPGVSVTETENEILIVRR